VASVGYMGDQCSFVFKFCRRLFFDVFPFPLNKANLKEYGNEADFLGFLHEPVRHRSITLCFKPFRFLLRICGDIRN
jgi:hypothetical protein